MVRLLRKFGLCVPLLPSPSKREHLSCDDCVTYCFTWTTKVTCVCCSVSGQVLTRQNIEDIIKFAKREKLFILADEVCTLLCVCDVYIIVVKIYIL